MHIPARKERESGRDYALRAIKENIIRLELKPGARISENELAAALGLSRTPVREALMELSRVKIVEIYPQRGSSIAQVDYALVDEAHFMRVTLECAVLERCCERGLSGRQRMHLEENLQMQDFHKNSKAEKQLSLDNEFHRQLFAAANLSNIYELMDSMTIHLDRIRTMHLYAVKNLTQVEDHHGIYQAVLQRDSKKAQQLMREHIGHYRTDEAEIRAKYSEYIVAEQLQS